MLFLYKNFFLILYQLVLFINYFKLFNCYEKVCGEFNSNKITKGVFSNDEISNKINEFSKKNLTEPTLCIYKFIGKKNEKVQIKFTSFDVKSLAPECIHEYIDVYIELTENTISKYVETNFLSRFCGTKRPNLLISYHNIILLAYHTDGKHRDSFFYGSFEFISAEPYNKNRITSNDGCEYEFNSHNEKSGFLMSPTYPGTYPSILDCTYKFIGKSNERVMVMFEEISIHFGAEHCPYDSIKLHDIITLKKPLEASASSHISKPSTYFDHINTYCGYKTNITVYSAASKFQIKFEAFDSLGTDEYFDDENKISLRKGFRAFYKFSEDFANLDFLTGTHVKGTNCDQRIVSIGDSTGLIYSPNYPNYYPINATCKYIFEGLDDNEYFETVKLVFHTYVDTISSDMLNNCHNHNGSYLTVYGSTKNNDRYCLSNDEIQSSEIRSLNAHMVLTFKSKHDKTNFGFVASYTFFTEFGISGTRVFPNRTCLFLYNSRAIPNGNINSPKYPQNYPINTECVYIFEIQSNERLLFTFKDFKIAQVPQGNQKCSSTDDHLSIYQIHDDTDNQTINNPNLINRYCGYKNPPPVITDLSVKSAKVHFYSNSMKYASGFYIYYDYLPKIECKYTLISNLNVSYQNIMITQEFDELHFCEWEIIVEKGQSILFTIYNFNIVDNLCNQFLLKFYDLNYSIKNSVYDYCVENDIRHLTIDSSHVRIQLILGNSFYLKLGKVVVNWIPATIGSENCNGFQCVQSKYCIDSKYFCDRISHCNDSSDEPFDCGVELKRSSLPIFKISAVLLIISISIILLSVCIIFKLTNAQKKQKQKSRYVKQPVYYKYASDNSVDYLEAAITSV